MLVRDTSYNLTRIIHRYEGTRIFNATNLFNYKTRPKIDYKKEKMNKNEIRQ